MEANSNKNYTLYCLDLMADENIVIDISWFWLK